jgi:1L-myo-inositol 1-phosphate cytidylyltransferase / CDP-L-myo-inositol myo-inositolphosphotransferase
MQPEHSRTAMPAAPALVLLPSVASLDASDVQMHDGEPSVLGLTLTQRTVMAARRAGYGQIFFLARDRAAPPGAATIPDWRRLADALVSSRAMSLIIAPATIVSQTDWLERLAATRIEPAAWASIPDRIVVLAATAIPDALAVLHAEGGAHDITAVADGLTRRFGSAAALPIAIDPLVVATSKDIRVAERRLLRGLVKDTDGFMARHFDRHISLQISRRLAPTAVKPTQISVLSTAIGVCGAPFFLSAHWSWQLVGALLFLAHSIVDGCDGELARLKFQESRYGGILDFWGDNVVHVAIFGCMAIGWALSATATWPLWLGAAAIVGTLGSAGFVHWRQLRAKDGRGPVYTSVSTVPDDRLAAMLDAASRRDFIYLVPILALFGKSSWLLLLAAIGAPIFFLLLVFLAVRERFQSRPVISTS